MTTSVMFAAPTGKVSGIISRIGRGVAVVLLVSLALRWALVLRGGQYYFSDEERYEKSRVTIERVLQGDPSGGFEVLFKSPEHLGYKVIGLVPAIIEQLTRKHLLIPAVFFSLFSLLNLYLIY